MKKVYGSLKMIIFVCFIFYLPFNLFIRDRMFTSANLGWFIPIGFIFFSGVVILFAFTSSWAYGEKGIELWSMTGKLIKKYNWNEVQSITRWSSTRGALAWPLLEMKDGNKLVIWYFSTRNYLNVLSDVVGYIQKKNPEAYVDLWVLKKLKKS